MRLATLTLPRVEARDRGRQAPLQRDRVFLEARHVADAGGLDLGELAAAVRAVNPREHEVAADEVLADLRGRPVQRRLELAPGTLQVLGSHLENRGLLGSGASACAENEEGEES